MIAVVLAGVFAFYWDSVRREKPDDANDGRAQNPETASTFIPAGFVLVPIEVANYESLDSILGQFGVVDLYRTSSDERSKPVKVATHVKILRAPLNPSHFAVLAPENESQKLVTYSGPFTVVVQNPNRSGTRFVKDPPDRTLTLKRVSRIQVEGSDATEKD
jgi:hypothetical protein